MPKRTGLNATYEAASAYRDRCIAQGASLLWPGVLAWTPRALQELRSAFIDKPDESDRAFVEKLRDQLANVSDDACRVATDLLAFYYLFPRRIQADFKVTRLKEVASIRELQDEIEFNAVRAAFLEGGIGYPGTYYNTGQPWHFAFLICFAQEAIQDPNATREPRTLEVLVERAASQVPRDTGLMENATLHLLLPDSFEPVASNPHKQQILAGFSSLDPKTGTIDERIASVRAGLTHELGRPDFDFYDKDIQPRWRAAAVESEPAGDGQSDLGPRVWVEKTEVTNRADRLEGSHALGSALWSPQRDARGADIYRFMRDVQPGDVILHLTDDRAFVGESRVAARVDDTFEGVPNTKWSNRPCYRVQLRNFEKLEPPLSRTVFFSEPYASRLRDLLDKGLRNVFYNKEPNLNQGAYLTPAPPQLLTVLNDAYRSIAGKELVAVPVARASQGLPNGEDSSTSTLQDVVQDFALELRTAGIAFGARHDAIARAFVVSLATKRFVILTGLSGSGKTQLALRFGEWLGSDRLAVIPVRPDWTGADALFGYEDALQPARNGCKSWHVPAALEFMLRAAADPRNPYLLLLDEMNLAHVERYFADVLSGMESEYACLPNLAREDDGQWRVRPNAAPAVPIPQNLFVVGTVNVDETTYMFSPKVLDRANTFEFRVSKSDLNSAATRPTQCQPGSRSAVAAFSRIACDSNSHVKNPHAHSDQFIERFTLLHDLLAESGFEYGHRVFVEAIRYAALLATAGDTSVNSALDQQIMQKILPRIHGSRKRVEPVLCSLGQYCYNLSWSPTIAGASSSATFNPTEVTGTPSLPISFDKIRRMTSLVRANQFVSFTE